MKRFFKWLWCRHETKIKLRIEGTKITSEWWSPELKEVLCGICDDKETCNPMTCLVANPWCG